MVNEAGVYLLQPELADGAEQVSSLVDYLEKIFPMAIGLLGLGSVVMIAYGGILYITSNIPGAKEDGKNKIRGAILGLVLALSSYLILHTISPELVSFKFLPESNQEQN